MTLQAVRINKYEFQEGGYETDVKKYDVADLVKAAENLEVFDLPLCGIALSDCFTNRTLKSFLYHYKRVENADLSYHIILADDGYVCDGWHRIAKAILEGRTTIKAKRLIVMPDGEEIKNS